MAECGAMRENMPLLLTESLDRDRRELTHQHIESCSTCSAEWTAYQDTWRMMGELPELEVPARVKDRVLAEFIAVAAPKNVVPFHRRAATKWLAQAAAVAVIAGGAYFAGQRDLQPSKPPISGPELTSVQPYSIAETRVLDAEKLSPTIEGRPDIQNIQFAERDPHDNKVGVSFDVTSRVTVKGNPNDPAMVQLLSYVLENDEAHAPHRSRTIEWVRQTYGASGSGNPEIANALAKVLRSDENEGVRIRAAETLKSVSMASQTREALIEALKSDPNPAVRIKAVEALVNLARSGSSFEPGMVDTLRQKAAQDDENLYVRVKAAEVLSNIRPQ